TTSTEAVHLEQQVALAPINCRVCPTVARVLVRIRDLDTCVADDREGCSTSTLASAPAKEGPSTPSESSRHNDYRSNQPHSGSNPSDNTILLTMPPSHTSSPKSTFSRTHQHYDSSEYSSNRSTFKGVFSNIVSSMS
ncbi:hypothetical protein BGW38_010450, partial [Lunasporangiospora selenospora]